LCGLGGWRFEAVVAARRALRTVDGVICAFGLVAEIGDLNCFEHPRKLMGFLGLVPSEHLIGESRVCQRTLAASAAFRLQNLTGCTES
jgi:Transposase IS116/IS110/IS902 family